MVQTQLGRILGANEHVAGFVGLQTARFFLPRKVQNAIPAATMQA
jgi:hypothetical protein